MDVWDDDDDEDGDTQPASTRETDRLRQKHYNEGYKESLKSAREEALQGGFEKGFAEGYTQGLLAGRIIGISSSAVELVHTLGFTSKEGIEKVLQDAKALNTESQRKSEDFIVKVKQVDAALSSILPPGLKEEFERAGSSR